VLISTNSTGQKRVKSIAIFTAAWVVGFMVGPLIGKMILDVFDYRILFQLSAFAISTSMIPAILLRKYGWPPARVKKEEELELRAGLKQMAKEISAYPSVSAVLIYYAITFGVVLAVYPAYMKEASLTDQEIEMLFFVFGLARFTTLYFVQKIARHDTRALALAVMATAVGMLISFMFTSLLSFAIALVLVGLATSIYYPVTFNIVTRNAPSNKMGAKLGIYEAVFGAGWTAGPIAAGMSSDAFGSASPYLAFFIGGTALATSIIINRKKR
jgi:predicted MFS family arabinose efflux permease